MQKVYILLRNNLQTGPYSLDEIVQLKLKNSDLVWVEGKSCGWSFPHEVAALQPYVPMPEEAVATSKNNEPIVAQHKDYLPAEETTPQPIAAPAKHIYVSLPANTIAQLQSAATTPEQTFAQKADAIRLRAQTYAATTESKTDDSLHTGYKRSLADVEEDYTTWVVKQKTKRKTVQPWMVACGVLLVLLLSGFILLRKPTSMAAKTAALTSHTATGRVTEAVPANTILPAAVKVKAEKKQPVKTIKATNNITAATKKTSVAKPVRKTEILQTVENKSAPVIMENNSTPPAEKKEQPATTTEQPKKKLAGKIDDFFNKFKIKKGKDEPVATPPTTTTEGERQATHRDDKTPTTEAADDIKSKVTLTSNEADENWMVGVRGLKITLHNRSNSTIKKATVAVNYYNEDNDLLDKKTVIFGNIPAGRQQTTAAPDHRLADHTTYTLLAAE